MERRLEQLEDGQLRQDETLRQHGESIAVLKSIQEDTNKHLAAIESKLDEVSKTYMTMQGTLASFVDMRTMIERQNKRIATLEKRFYVAFGVYGTVIFILSNFDSVKKLL